MSPVTPKRSVGERVRVMDSMTARQNGINNLRGRIIEAVSAREDMYLVQMDNGATLEVSGALPAGDAGI